MAFVALHSVLKAGQEKRYDVAHRLVWRMEEQEA
jgi:hypothetical protein